MQAVACTVSSSVLCPLFSVVSALGFAPLAACNDEQGYDPDDDHRADDALGVGDVGRPKLLEPGPVAIGKNRSGATSKQPAAARPPAASRFYKNSISWCSSGKPLTSEALWPGSRSYRCSRRIRNSRRSAAGTPGAAVPGAAPPAAPPVLADPRSRRRQNHAGSCPVDSGMAGSWTWISNTVSRPVSVAFKYFRTASGLLSNSSALRGVVAWLLRVIADVPGRLQEQ